MALERELALSFFLLCLFVCEKVISRWHGSPLVGNLLAGIILGPSLLNILDEEVVMSLQLMGKLGVMLLVLESGLKLDPASLRGLLTRGCSMAAVGVIMPIACTIALFSTLASSKLLDGEKNVILTAVLIGCALAPTSIGFTTVLLEEFQQKEKPWARIAMTAAVVDDVLSLLLLSVVVSVTSSTNANAWTYIGPIVWSLGLCFVTYSSIKAIVWVRQSSIKRAFTWLQPYEFVIMLLVAALFAWLAAYLGSSDLLGCFLVGLMFYSFPDVHKTWDLHIPPILNWGVRIFFGATIAFSLPELSTAQGGMFQGSSLAMGFLLLLCSLGGKHFTGLFASPLSWSSFHQLGFAMQGRGEFSFLIASIIANGGLSRYLYSATVWALLMTSLSSPVAFRYIMTKEQRKNKEAVAHASDHISPVESTENVENDVKVHI